MASYRLTKKATEDLAHIWNYTVDTWSENQADHYFQMLLDSCQDISDRRVFGKHAGKHIIFYRMINRDVVDIVRILHERMDLKKRIRE